MSKLAPLHYRKTAAGFIPVSASAREFHAKTKLGQTIELRGRRPRNPAHHRKLFALLGIVAENVEQFSSAECVLIAVKAALGHGKWVLLSGAAREIFIPDSIDFSSMSQDEFEPFYEAAVAAVRRWWLPVNDDELREAVDAFAA